jgi:ferredoxin-NADP reductase
MYKSKLISKQNIAEDTLEFEFKKPDNFEFISGQFIQIKIPNTNEEKNILRCYSIVSTPDDENIRLVVKIISGGLGTTYLKNLNINDEIEFGEATGHFILNEDTKKQYFIATGCGIASISSIIKDLLNKKTDHEVHLLFGLRNEDNIFWTEKFDEWKTEYPNFNYNLTLSQPSESWTGMKGRVTEHVPKDVADTNFYMCGSMPMVKEIRDMLGERGIDKKNIHFEIF